MFCNRANDHENYTIYNFIRPESKKNLKLKHDFFFILYVPRQVCNRGLACPRLGVATLYQRFGSYSPKGTSTIFNKVVTIIC